MSPFPRSRIVADLPTTVPFVPPEALARRLGRPIRLRLGANENSFGASPKAIAAMKDAATRCHLYNDPEGFELRSALANFLFQDESRCNNIILGSGVDDLIALVIRMVANPGDPMVMSLGAYPTFAFHAKGHGGKLIAPPYRDNRNDWAALAAAARVSHARVVYLANPDSPSGTWLTAAEQENLLEGLPGDCLLVLDEAYGEFAPPGALLQTDPDDPRLIRLRTFSKAYGMAGLRIGYGIACAEMTATLDKIRNHFGVNLIAQAGALAALADGEHLAYVLAEVAAGRDDYRRLAASLGLPVLPSATNFIAMDVGSADRAEAVADALLKDEGVFVRRPGAAPLNRCIRVTVGAPEERRLCGEALERVMARLKPPHADPGR